MCSHDHNSHTHQHPDHGHTVASAIFAYVIGLLAFLLGLIPGQASLLVNVLYSLTVILSGYHVLSEGLL